MKLVIMQPYLFPYIGYFQLLAAADRFVIYDDVQFIKGGWINRNRLLVNGQPWLFTVPLDQPSPNRLIRDIELQITKPWRSKLLQTITQNYQKTPHFEAVNELLTRIFSAEARTIADLVRVSLTTIVEYLQLPVQIVPSSTIYNNTHLKAQERVLDICLQEHASTYINAPGGRALYSAEVFERNGITLKFIDAHITPYQQAKKNDAFVPGLSMIDVLMNNSVSEVQKLLNQYSLS